jgi:hypothetical protein
LVGSITERRMNICKLGPGKKKATSKSAQRKEDAYWQELIQAQRLSGLSQKQFCTQEGISHCSFRNRAYRLKDKLSLGNGPGSFVRAVVTPEATSLNKKKAINGPTVEPSVGSPPKDLEIRLGRLVVVVPAGFDGETLRRLMGIIHV